MMTKQSFVQKERFCLDGIKAIFTRRRKREKGSQTARRLREDFQCFFHAGDAKLEQRRGDGDFEERVGGLPDALERVAGQSAIAVVKIATAMLFETEGSEAGEKEIQ